MNRTIGRPMEILLVEDNLDDARGTIEALRDEHVRCRVNLVCDGEEAMSFLRREAVFARAPRPDLILLDMELPKKDGWQVLEELRADEDLKGIAVIVLTASRIYQAILEAKGLHVDGFLTKPVSLDQFIDEIKSIRRTWIADFVLQAEA